jgi:hypothetical protein
MLQNYNSLFPDFPGKSRVWIYSSNKPFDSTESNYVQEALDGFIQSWAAHGKGLHASGKLIEDRFIVIVADESTVSASGCSIDSSVRFIKQLQDQLNNNFFDRLQLTITNGDELKSIHISDLKDYPKWYLFDPMIADLETFRTSFLKPVSESALYEQLK